MIIKGKYEALTVAVVGVLARPKSPVSVEVMILSLDKERMIISFCSLLGMIHQVITSKLLIFYNQLCLLTVHIQWTHYH